MNTPLAARGWQARLELRFARRSERTELIARRHHGPLVVQKSFHPEGPVCHAYLLHPPGGVVGGDELELDVAIEAGGHALLTTPGAGKFYRSAGPQARVVQHFSVADDAVLEWLPQETIVFAGTRTRMSCDIVLAATARCIAWEITCLGRPASNAPYDSGEYLQQLRLWRENKPLLWEATRHLGGSEALEALWGMQGYAVTGSLLATPATATNVTELRELAGPAVRVGISRIGDVLVCRALAADAEPLKTFFERVWAALRPAMLDRPACPPRIWRT